MLDRTELGVRRSLSQQGILVATRENVRLQQQMDRLTRLIIVLTILGLFVAITVPLVIAMDGNPDGKIMLQRWRSNTLLYLTAVISAIQRAILAASKFLTGSEKPI